MPLIVRPIILVYPHSMLCGGLRKTYVFGNRVHIGCSRSSEVNDFGTNRKRLYDFLIVIEVTLVLFCTVSEIWRLIG